MISFREAIASCGGLGRLPFGSGTWTSLVALWFWSWAYHSRGFSVLDLALMVVLLFVAGVWAIQKLPQDYEADDSRIVMDEWIGMGIAVLGSNFGFWQLLIAFILFRFFDITKVLGVRYFDRHHWRGLGVMLDDVLAGLYAAGILWLWNMYVG